MDRLIELIEQWEDGKGLKDENIIDFLSKVKDFEKELLKALLMRLRSNTKNLELYRYTCDICGASFKIEYETKGSSINYCPFCGTGGDKGVTVQTSNVTFIELAEGSKHIEVWISTNLLDNTVGSAYLVDIDKDILLREDKVVKQGEPFIYADHNEPILTSELELVEEVLSYINRDLFIQVKTSFPHPITILGVDVGFKYTEEYIENMRRGVM